MIWNGSSCGPWDSPLRWLARRARGHTTGTRGVAHRGSCYRIFSGIVSTPSGEPRASASQQE